MAWGDHRFNLSLSGESRYAEGLLVSGDYFRVLEVPALAGRLITNDDDKRGCGSPGVVISFGFWQWQLAGSAAAVGLPKVVMAASFVPARRASRLDPMISLRSE